MAIDTTSRKVGRFGRRSGSPRATTLPIGETDSNIFSCPSCSRPLGKGVSLCPGCGTRLLAGVQLQRAVGFIAIGLVAGTLVGGGVMGVASAAASRSADGVIGAPPIVIPTQVPISTAVAPIVDPAIPASALSALGQSAVLNQRVLIDADRLTQALASAAPSGAEIAPVLRSLASTAAFAHGVAIDVGDWDDGAAVSASLVSFYGSVTSIAEDGLSASVGNSRAYVVAAEQMLEAIAGLTELDAASRVLAARADLELPSIRPPDAVITP
jgi:ribosomal protein L37AE/L43A